MAESDLRIAYAGDRQIAVDVLRYLVAEKVRPVALLLPTNRRASHAEELLAICKELPEPCIMRGDAFRTPGGVGVLRNLDLDFIVSVHFPYLVPPSVLRLPKYGAVNLHPALLPYNRGWHTSTWAILDDTPAGATLHFMDDGLDTGDVIHQREVPVLPEDTADSLYRRILATELEIFREAWPALRSRNPSRSRQPGGIGTSHKRDDLFQPKVQELRQEDRRPVGDVLRQLRALSTSNWREACYFDTDGRRLRIRVEIVDDSTL